MSGEHEETSNRICRPNVVPVPSPVVRGAVGEHVTDQVLDLDVPASQATIRVTIP